MTDERARMEAVARAYEDALISADRDGRRRKGAFYTPPELVDWILDRAFDVGGGDLSDAGPRRDRRVLDPACGTGHFLVAAARRLGDVLAVHGSDTDPDAVRIARMRLSAEDQSVPKAEIAARIRVADGLTAWEGQTFDAVIGNPPFLGQLRTRTAGQTGRRGEVGPYTDTSAVFLRHALDLVGEGGVVALVQPLSVLATRDAGPVREAIAERGAVTDFRVDQAPVFRGTQVRTCVPVVRVGAVGGPGPTQWGELAASYFGIPRVTLPRATGTLGEIASCTADFRDQYYGLIPHVREEYDAAEADRAPLITSGLIEPAACGWGSTTTTFAKRRYTAPVVDLGTLRSAGDLAGWADSRLVPKVLVAGQGRVIEAVVDAEGEWLPSVPVVSVVPHRREDLWRILALLLAPPVVAHAAARYLGTGLSSGSVKVSARQLAGLPLPADDGAWDEGARVAREIQSAGESRRFAELGELMSRAYRMSDEVATAWWLDRVTRAQPSA